MKRKSLITMVLIVLMSAFSMAAEEKAEKEKKMSKEPDRIKVQHILISFTGKLPGKNITRNPEEAKKLAYDLLERAKKGEDFDAMVKEYTDDSHPGIYGMTNNSVAPNQGEYPRGRMVPAFGNVGFKLEVGGVGIADFDQKESPYGYHIIKRIE